MHRTPGAIRVLVAHARARERGYYGATRAQSRRATPRAGDGPRDGAVTTGELLHSRYPTRFPSSFNATRVPGSFAERKGGAAARHFLLGRNENVHEAFVGLSAVGNFRRLNWRKMQPSTRALLSEELPRFVPPTEPPGVTPADAQLQLIDLRASRRVVARRKARSATHQREICRRRPVRAWHVLAVTWRSAGPIRRVAVSTTIAPLP